MRILVLGGSWFVGRTVVTNAATRGHDVTVFNRGVTPTGFPENIRQVRGNRENTADLTKLTSHGPWDAVVDVSGSVPAVVLSAAEQLAPAVEHYTFVSTISAYRDWPHAPVDEDSPLWDADPHLNPPSRKWDPDAYGPLKVGCETACQLTIDASKLLILRPHVVLGPFEYVGRLPWWLRRMHRGGQVLAPAPDRSIQPVDVRDLADFLLDRVEERAAGIFNVAAAPDGATYGDMLSACADAIGNPRQPIELVWTNEDWLVRHGVTQWTELPLWRNAAAPWAMSTERARAAGLRCRPIRQTAVDTWTWMQNGGRPVSHERAGEHGIDAVKESALIKHWLAEMSRR